MIDLSEMRQIDIEEPSSDGSYVSLRDTPLALADAKGKGKAGSTSVARSEGQDLSSLASPQSESGKRRRSPEPDAALPRNDVVANFLSRSLPQDEDGPSPSIRRKIGTSDVTDEGQSTRSTSLQVTDAPPTLPPSRASIRSGDPFGYLDEAPSHTLPPQGHFTQPLFQAHQTLSSSATVLRGMPSSSGLSLNQNMAMPSVTSGLKDEGDNSSNHSSSVSNIR